MLARYTSLFPWSCRRLLSCPPFGIPGVKQVLFGHARIPERVKYAGAVVLAEDGCRDGGQGNIEFIGYYGCRPPVAPQRLMDAHGIKTTPFSYFRSNESVIGCKFHNSPGYNAA